MHRRALHRRPLTKCVAMQIGRSRSSSKKNKSEPPSRQWRVNGAGTLPIRFWQGPDHKLGNGFHERQFPEELLPTYSLHLARFMEGAKEAGRDQQPQDA